MINSRRGLKIAWQTFAHVWLSASITIVSNACETQRKYTAIKCQGYDVRIGMQLALLKRVLPIDLFVPLKYTTSNLSKTLPL